LVERAAATRVLPRGKSPNDPAAGGFLVGPLRPGFFYEAGVLLLLVMIIGIMVVLVAVILSASENQQQRERRVQRDLDLKR
jgi:hypothetical protein